MKGRSESAGRFGQPLGRSPSRCREVQLHLLRAENIHQCAQNRRLSGAGTAGEDAHLLAEGGAHGFGLFGGEFDVGFLLRPGDGSIDFDRG